MPKNIWDEKKYKRIEEPGMIIEVDERVMTIQFYNNGVTGFNNLNNAE